MNVSTLEAPTADHRERTASRATSAVRAPAGTPGRTANRPVRRAGQGTGPRARPLRRLDTPVITRGGAAAPRGCRVTTEAADVRRPTPWRLTDRAVALVLVTGLVLVTAALAVVGLTAVRVTGDRYQGHGLSSVVASAPPSLP